jgi:co-chaperonin GroES (HSP10)
MASIRKKLTVVGDRILVKPEAGEERTRAGLYLPATAVAEQQARGGSVVGVGPGIPIPELADYDEPWKKREQRPRYLPLQAKVGDYAIFLKNAAIEITFQKEHYLIVPNSAVLALIREELDLPQDLGDKLDGLAELDDAAGGDPGRGSDDE